MKELQEQINKHKRNTLSVVLSLICVKQLKEDLTDKDTKDIFNLVCYMEKHFPKVFEALYKQYWDFKSKMLNEDGTLTEEAENWKDYL